MYCLGRGVSSCASAIELSNYSKASRGLNYRHVHATAVNITSLAKSAFLSLSIVRACADTIEHGSASIIYMASFRELRFLDREMCFRILESKNPIECGFGGFTQSTLHCPVGHTTPSCVRAWLNLLTPAHPACGVIATLCGESMVMSRD